MAFLHPKTTVNNYLTNILEINVKNLIILIDFV